MFEEVFERRKQNVKKLIAYGFKAEDNQWVYYTDIKDGEFLLEIRIDENGDCDTCLTEKETGDEYVLYKTNAVGNYVGEIRYAVEVVLRDIAEKCYDCAVFKTAQAELLIDYVRNTYGDELEFLWQKFPDNAVWRRKDNNKWYGAILTVEGAKIGLKTNKIVEIIDLRMNPENKEEILSNENYYPGWHMNKNSWFRLCLTVVCRMTN